MSDLLEILDQFEETLLGGKAARFGGGWVVDREALLDLIDRLRASAPREIENARLVLTERDGLLRRAEEAAQIVVAKARQEAELAINTHDIAREAQRRASDIVEEARASAQQAMEEARKEAAGIRGEATSQAVEQAVEADRYSLDVLRRLETQMASIMASVRAGIEQLDAKLQRETEQFAVDRRDAEIRELHEESRRGE